jgi:hypothetical protein
MWTWEDIEGQNPCKWLKSDVDPLSDEAIKGLGKTWEDRFNLPRFFPKFTEDPPQFQQMVAP